MWEQSERQMVFLKWAVINLCLSRWTRLMMKTSWEFIYWVKNMNRKRCLWCSSNSLQRNLSPWLSVLLIKIWPFSCCMWQDSSQSPVFLLNAEFLLLDLTVFPHRISTFFLDLQIFSVLVASPVFVLQIYQFVSLENCIYSSFNLAGWSFMNLLFYHFNFFHHKFVVFLLKFNTSL